MGLISGIRWLKARVILVSVVLRLRWQRFKIIRVLDGLSMGTNIRMMAASVDGVPLKGLKGDAIATCLEVMLLSSVITGHDVLSSLCEKFDLESSSNIGETLKSAHETFKLAVDARRARELQLVEIKLLRCLPIKCAEATLGDIREMYVRNAQRYSPEQAYRILRAQARSVIWGQLVDRAKQLGEVVRLFRR